MVLHNIIDMKSILLLLFIFALIHAVPMYSCDKNGYGEYLDNYRSKCGINCEEYRAYYSELVS